MIIVDTNIVFSALLNANRLIEELLLNSQNEFQFYCPELMQEEIQRYSGKLIKAPKLTESQFSQSYYRIFRHYRQCRVVAANIVMCSDNNAFSFIRA
ncbi:hypothetical protein AHMF7605_19555 [Adhaeribacter arboris]|uniref:PIN domain-containing protein n=1 Tax=Adhaeribacter arboris TaxID=2072846 RepID=A0A2T2YJ62_9BACT|nr:hypothetical protein AHMF7605_19555 [Adhaeribacter arboris]